MDQQLVCQIRKSRREKWLAAFDRLWPKKVSWTKCHFVGSATSDRSTFCKGLSGLQENVLARGPRYCEAQRRLIYRRADRARLMEMEGCDWRNNTKHSNERPLAAPERRAIIEAVLQFRLLANAKVISLRATTSGTPLFTYPPANRSVKRGAARLPRVLRRGGCPRSSET
jgi:hypothetical protein